MQNLDRHAPVELFVVGGIDDAQTAFAEFAFDAKTGQDWRWFLAGGWRFGPDAPLPHAQTGFNAFAGFPADCLWIQALFKDTRGWFETPAQAVRGLPMDATTAGGESFGGQFLRAANGVEEAAIFVSSA